MIPYIDRNSQVMCNLIQVVKADVDLNELLALPTNDLLALPNDLSLDEPPIQSFLEGFFVLMLSAQEDYSYWHYFVIAFNRTVWKETEAEAINAFIFPVGCFRGP